MLQKRNQKKDRQNFSPLYITDQNRGMPIKIVHDDIGVKIHFIDKLDYALVIALYSMITIIVTSSNDNLYLYLT